MHHRGGTLYPAQQKFSVPFGPFREHEQIWFQIPKNYHYPEERISNEAHARQLKIIEQRLDKLCAHFDVTPLPPLIPAEAILLEEAAGGCWAEEPPRPVLLAKPPEPETRKESLERWEAEHKEISRRFAEYVRMAGLPKNRAIKKEPAIKIVSQDTVHSPLVMAEIKTTLIRINILRTEEIVASFSDQHGIPWGVTFFLNGVTLILELDTKQCPEILGNFRLMLRCIHPSPLKTFPKTILVSIRSMQTCYPLVLGSITHMMQEGYMTREGIASIRVAIVPVDTDADRSCSLWVEQRNESPQRPPKTPRYITSRFTLTNYTITHTKSSPKLLDQKRTAWHLVVSMNRGVESLHREFISVFVKRNETSAYHESCHEYFVELCLADGADGKRRSGHRRTGRLMTQNDLIPKFIAKGRLGEYLQDNTLQFFWGIREVPIR